MKVEKAIASIELKGIDKSVKKKTLVDTWDIIFTDKGPRSRKVPIEFEVI